MTDFYTSVDVNTQITHLGYRFKDGKTDLIIGFRCFGEFTDNTKVEFMLSDEHDLPTQKITNYWEPTLRNTRGFLQTGVNGPEPFRWPAEFEPCDDIYINGEHLDNLGPEQPGVYLAFCTVDWIMDRFALCGYTTPNE